MIIDISSFFTAVAHAQEAAQSTSPVAVLGLNLQLFIAQLINFAIVLFILWKWVFTPVTKALQKRTAKIEQSLNDVDRISKDKEEFEHWRQTEMGKARQEASSIISKSQTAATELQKETLQKTTEEQQKLIDAAKKQLEQEKNLQLQSAKSELADLVTNATEKILRSKLDKQKDQELIKESLKNM